MKAKYFPDGDFLTAKLGANPSFMWRSIMAAQEIVRKGCRRKIGDGRQTDVWKVPWLPCAENGCLTTIMPQELEGSKVCDLMEVNHKQWDEGVLRDVCNERDRNLIKRIPLSSRVTKDSWFWFFDEKGCFSVRSCYRLLQGEISAPYATFWKKLWSLQLPPKVTHFLWRMCNLCLPTATRLITKRIQIDEVCQWCRSAPETDIHVFFECEIAHAVWMAVDLHNVINILPPENIMAVIGRLFQRCTRDQCSLVAAVCWHMWNRRNKWIWDKINISVFGLKAAAVNMVAEWKSAQEGKVTGRGNNGGSSAPRSWERPPVNWVKINVDAALFGNLNCIGLGMVARDAAGKFIMARSRRQENLASPREAEAMCLKEALSWMKNKGFKNCLFETDSQILAQACKGDRGDSYFHTIVRDCIDNFKHYDEVRVCFAHRSANEAAHALAREAYSVSGYREWHENAPDFIHHVIFSESL